MTFKSLMLLDFFCQIHKKLVNTVFKSGFAQCHNGKFRLKVVSVYKTEFFMGRGCPVLPYGADGVAGVPYSVFRYVFAVFYIKILSAMLILTLLFQNIAYTVHNVGGYVRKIVKHIP